MPSDKNKKSDQNQKETISPDNHATNVGQRGGTGADHDEEPNTGMKVGNDGGNKVQGDDLESIIPGKDTPVSDENEDVDDDIEDGSKK